MNDQNNPNDPMKSQDNNPQVTPPAEPVQPAEEGNTVISPTPLTPKPGEVVRPSIRSDISSLAPTPASEAVDRPVVPENAPTEKPAQSYPSNTIPVPSVQPSTPPVEPVIPQPKPDMPAAEPQAPGTPSAPVEDRSPMLENSETPELSSPEMPEEFPKIEAEQIMPPTATPAVSSTPETVETSATNTVVPNDTPMPVEVKPKKSGKKLLIVLFVFFIFAAAIGGAVYILMSNGYLEPTPEEEVVEEATGSEEIMEEPEEQDVTSLRYLDTLFKGLDSSVEELRSDTNFEDTMNISTASEF